MDTFLNLSMKVSSCLLFLNQINCSDTMIEKTVNVLPLL